MESKRRKKVDSGKKVKKMEENLGVNFKVENQRVEIECNFKWVDVMWLPNYVN